MSLGKFLQEISGRAIRRENIFARPDQCHRRFRLTLPIEDGRPYGPQPWNISPIYRCQAVLPNLRDELLNAFARWMEIRPFDLQFHGSIKLDLNGVRDQSIRQERQENSTAGRCKQWERAAQTE